MRMPWGREQDETKKQQLWVFERDTLQYIRKRMAEKKL